MSRNFAVLGKANSDRSFPESSSSAERPFSEEIKSPSGSQGAHGGVWVELIRQLFKKPSAVTLVSVGTTGSVAEELATELGAAGKRVVIVAADRLLRLNPIPVPEETSLVPATQSNVWLWPAPLTEQVEFFRPRVVAGAGNWLDSLRRNFGVVLLDCSSTADMTAVAELAAMADSAVLIVEAGRTTKQQIRDDQQRLRLRGARLAGSILIGHVSSLEINS